MPNERKRTAHTLKRSGSSRLPRRMIFFDVETEPKNDKGDQRMTLLVACYWNINKKTDVESLEWFDTKSMSKFYEWIIKHLRVNVAVRIMSANVWFDYRNSKLYDCMRKDNWQCVNSFSKGHVTILKFKKGSWRLELINIQNYFNTSVKGIGDSIKLPKLSVDFSTVNKKDLFRYCKRDVEIIYTAFRKLYMFVKENDLGNMGNTLPALAHSCFTHKFMSHKLKVHAEMDIIKMERQAYFGGRCECFFIGKPAKGRYYKVDVNAMYPFVMRSNYFPIEYKKLGVNRPTELMERLAPTFCYVAECEIETNVPVYPYRRDVKLIFPTGRFTTTLTTPSLLYGIKHGHVKKILRVACYRKAIIFKEFVDYFYNNRIEFIKSKNAAFSYICKLMLNSLYGKFGQRRSVVVYDGKTKLKENFRVNIVHAQTKKHSIRTVFFGRDVITERGEEEAHQSMPTIAAHVTDYARLYLWSLIEKAGLRNCFYCDTDSLIVNEAGYKRLSGMLDPFTLGLLKVEGIETKIDIRGAKNYVFGKEEKIKGIPKNAKQNKDGSFTYPVFPGMITELRRGIKDDYRIETQTKHISGIYDKGIVTKSGRVKPHNLRG